MDYNFSSDKPIYLQLMDTFIQAIASGELSKGAKLESVRDLAVQAKVNPNTMQKALTELERLELIRTERTSGRFITDDEEKIQDMKKELAQKRIKAFTEQMSALGYTPEQTLTLVKDFYSGN